MSKIFVEYWTDWVVFKTNIPLSFLREKYENQFWIKNKFYFKNYCSWYKITQEFENLIPLQWEQSHFLNEFQWQDVVW